MNQSNTSPLGQYAPLVAAITSVGMILLYLIALVTNSPNQAQIAPFAYVGLGVIFGGATAINGWKATTDSLNTRISSTEAAQAATMNATNSKPAA
jgi:hypothetical protein